MIGTPVTMKDGSIAYRVGPARGNVAAKPPSVDKLRQQWIWHWQREAKRLRQWARWQMVGPFYSKPLPKDLRGLFCGAKTRGGAPCKRHDISKHNGRCKLHGGASTGPRTAEGKARVADNLGEFAKLTP